MATYTHGDSSWGDLLTKYNGQSITYDAIGNPLTYRDGIQLTWQNGRELATFKKGTVDVSYTYDTGGLRTSKSVVEDFVSTEYDYVYENGLLRQMTYGNHVYNISYDAYGTPVLLNHIIPTSGLNEYYYYGTNSRGDVEALYYSDGSLYATYDYDAYGKLLAITSFSGSDLTGTDTVATKNPLRYRSYVYDTETGLYYLQSRYYDPTTCRFINADIYYETGQGITGYNMFAYCNNNPVMFSDPLGTLVTYSGVTYSGQEFHNVPAHQLGWYGQIKEYSIDSVVYDVPLYDQGEHDLCWAYSQVMVEDYNSGITKTQDEADQAAIALAIQQNGSNWDQGNWPTNCQEYYSNGVPVPVYGINNINELLMTVSNYGPIYAYYTGTSPSHLVVITGVDAYNDIVYTNNPQKKYGKQSYIQFIEGYVGGPTDRSCRFKYYYLCN